MCDPFICSSSNMLEDLLLSQNEMALRDLMISIKKVLQSESQRRDFEVYKFIGDGWISIVSTKCKWGRSYPIS